MRQMCEDLLCLLQVFDLKLVLENLLFLLLQVLLHLFLLVLQIRNLLLLLLLLLDKVLDVLFVVGVCFLKHLALSFELHCLPLQCHQIRLQLGYDFIQLCNFVLLHFLDCQDLLRLVGLLAGQLFFIFHF